MWIFLTFLSPCKSFLIPRKLISRTAGPCEGAKKVVEELQLGWEKGQNHSFVSGIVFTEERGGCNFVPFSLLTVVFIPYDCLSLSYNKPSCYLNKKEILILYYRVNQV